MNSKTINNKTSYNEKTGYTTIAEAEQLLFSCSRLTK